MSDSPVHDKQRKKNYAIFLALIAFAVVIFAVSIIKMQGH
jgi:hypothetical protein